MKYVADIPRKIRYRVLRLSAIASPPFPTLRASLILAPHPDDETLGCAGLIQRLCAQGYSPHVVILTGGGKSHADCCPMGDETLKQARRALAQGILADLGLPATHLHLLDFPDGAISPLHPQMEVLQGLVADIAPRSVFIPHHGEGWPDHLVVQEMLRELPLPAHAEVYQYCVWLWFYNVWKLDWKKARLLSLSPAEWQHKCAAVRKYVSELAPCGKPWSGVLPELLVKACMWKKELYFKLK